MLYNKPQPTGITMVIRNSFWTKKERNREIKHSGQQQKKRKKFTIWGKILTKFLTKLMMLDRQKMTFWTKYFLCP